MTTIVFHHDISTDLEHWLSSPKRKEMLGSIGVTNIRTFVDPKDTTHVALTMDVSDMNAFMALIQSTSASEAMARDGVIPSSLRFLVEKKIE
jgi:hypothetical protein